MNRHFILTLALGALLMGAHIPAHSQAYPSVPVEISTEKVKAADGTMCYSHIVRERQTLYSICKTYNVAIEDKIGRAHV